MMYGADELAAALDAAFAPEEVSSVELLYEHMDSQSGECLPVIYKPFDATQRMHWRERGAVWDFMWACNAWGRRVLDFGPGDGWPSLVVAPYVAEVVGVDGSKRRADVCTGNATRMGIGNAEFVQAAPGEPLPFGDESFDAVMVASAVEQTPDPAATVCEFQRVLRPGGRLRIRYEALQRYRGGHEVDRHIQSMDDGCTRVIIFCRCIDEEYVRQYALTCAAADEEMLKRELTPGWVAEIAPKVTHAQVCVTRHPGGESLARMLAKAGFREVYGTHDGIDFGGRMFDAIAADARPDEMQGVDAVLRPVVKGVVELRAPLGDDPALTAAK
jgi:ubiquinone/menaquinone biosynthesis C-methylase UbiE